MTTFLRRERRSEARQEITSICHRRYRHWSHRQSLHRRHCRRRHCRRLGFCIIVVFRPLRGTKGVLPPPRRYRSQHLLRSSICTSSSSVDESLLKILKTLSADILEVGWRRGWTRKKGGFRGQWAWRLCRAQGKPLQLLLTEVNGDEWVLVSRTCITQQSQRMWTTGCTKWYFGADGHNRCHRRLTI